jgi:hypothetical protein
VFWSLRRHWLRRLVLAVVVGTFLPVVSATVACQIGCAFADMSSAEVSMGGHQDGMASSANGQVHPGSHLQHGGPCHVGAVPALLMECDKVAVPSVRSHWNDTNRAMPVSYIWPPPEHRPRTV